jgi:hypothetical protein
MVFSIKEFGFKIPILAKSDVWECPRWTYQRPVAFEGICRMIGPMHLDKRVVRLAIALLFAAAPYVSAKENLCLANSCSCGNRCLV